LEGYLETYMYKKRRFVNLLLTKGEQDVIIISQKVMGGAL
jgi:hypothetical protein